MIDWTRAPIRSACWRVHLIGGVERNAFWWLVFAAGITSGTLWYAGVWQFVPIVIASTGGVLGLLRRATVEDPMATSIWLRWVLEKPYTPAVGRFDSRSRGRRRRR